MPHCMLLNKKTLALALDSTEEELQALIAEGTIPPPERLGRLQRWHMAVIAPILDSLIPSNQPPKHGRSRA